LDGTKKVYLEWNMWKTTKELTFLATKKTNENVETVRIFLPFGNQNICSGVKYEEIKYETILNNIF
jgi:hypothetical protein